MFSFFGNRNKDSSKKSSSEGGTDGFVIIGEKQIIKRQPADFVRVRDVYLLDTQSLGVQQNFDVSGRPIAQ